MNKIINFIESEWYRPAIVCFTIFLMFFFLGCLSIAEKREANRIEKQTESWIEQGYPIRKKAEAVNTINYGNFEFIQGTDSQWVAGAGAEAPRKSLILNDLRNRKKSEKKLKKSLTTEKIFLLF